jgi:hypothetical protein
MNEALEIFAAGLGGVFIGMTLLYIAIRLTRMAADALSKGESNGK